jgi:peroxin-2
MNSSAFLLLTSQQEFLLFLLPLVSIRSIRRRLNILISRMMTALPSLTEPISAKLSQNAHQKLGKYRGLPRDQCAICAENSYFSMNNLADSANALASFTSPTQSPDSHSKNDDEPPANPITTPYITSCGHTYCYHCISERMMRTADDSEGRWECLRCGEAVQNAARWEPHVAQSELSGSDGYNDEYEFSSDLDVSEVSTGTGGSLGSYSHSEGGLSD